MATSESTTVALSLRVGRLYHAAEAFREVNKLAKTVSRLGLE